jgi:hypothetical protein
MKTPVIMILGRGLWVRDGGGWARTEWVPRALRPGLRDAVLLYEPDGLGHQAVEVPRVSRAVFASLEKVRQEFPVVGSEALGWGIEPPEPAAGGAYSTLLHFELTPGLLDLTAEAGPRAAWSAFTVAAACLPARDRAARTRCVLFLLPGFVALAAAGAGKRSFRSWPAPLSERDWGALAFLLGELDPRAPVAMAEAELRRGPVTIVAEGDSGRACPFWGDLEGSGRVEAVLDLDALAECAARLPGSHPANLLEAFPRPYYLDRVLVAAGATGLATAAFLAVLALMVQRAARAESAVARDRAAALAAEVATLEHNRAEMEELRREVPEAGETPAGDRGSALRRLVDAVPDSLTLTALSIGQDEAFRIEGLVTGPDFDAEGTRRLLARSGFAPQAQGGWAFDAATGRLSVRGSLGKALP